MAQWVQVIFQAWFFMHKKNFKCISHSQSFEIKSQELSRWASFNTIFTVHMRNHLKLCISGLLRIRKWSTNISSAQRKAKMQTGHSILAFSNSAILCGSWKFAQKHFKQRGPHLSFVSSVKESRIEQKKVSFIHNLSELKKDLVLKWIVDSEMAFFACSRDG